MLSQKDLQKINECEKAGMTVVVISSDGRLDYATQEIGNSEYCDKCSSFRLFPDPDPYDWFRDGDMKAVCLLVNGVIEGSLEKPSEWTNICKPLYCPLLGRELSDEEKKQAAERLKWAKERFQGR